MLSAAARSSFLCLSFHIALVIAAAARPQATAFLDKASGSSSTQIVLLPQTLTCVIASLQRRAHRVWPGGLRGYGGQLHGLMALLEQRGH